MRESLIEQKVCAVAKKNGWLVHPKAAAGTRGWPDRVFSKVPETTLGIEIRGDNARMMRDTRLIFVEFKAPSKKPTRLQSHMHQKLKAQGYEVHVIDSVEDGTALFA